MYVYIYISAKKKNRGCKHVPIVGGYWTSPKHIFVGDYLPNSVMFFRLGHLPTPEKKIV